MVMIVDGKGMVAGRLATQISKALKKGEKVTVVEVDSSNIKITRQSDIAIAEAIIKSRPKPKPQGPIGPYVEAQW